MRSGADILAARASLDTTTRDQETTRKQQLVTGPVIIYNAFCLLPVDKRLAANYVYAITFVYIPDFLLLYRVWLKHQDLLGNVALCKYVSK